jgi:hypothetical protein
MGHPTAAVPENVSGDALKQDAYRSLGPGPSDGTIAPLEAPSNLEHCLVALFVKPVAALQYYEHDGVGYSA